MAKDEMIEGVTRCRFDTREVFGGRMCLICDHNENVHCSYVPPICTYNGPLNPP